MTKWVHRALTRAPQHVDAPSGASTIAPWHRREPTSRVDDRSLRAKVVASSVAEGTLTCRGAFGERRRGSPGCASAVVERCRWWFGIPRWGRRALQRALCAVEGESVFLAEGALAFLGGLTARRRGHLAQTRRGARRRRRVVWHSWVGGARVAEGTVQVRRGSRLGRGGVFGMLGRSLGGTAIGVNQTAASQRTWSTRAVAPVPRSRSTKRSLPSICSFWASSGTMSVAAWSGRRPRFRSVGLWGGGPSRTVWVNT